jgi:hypothetical protein
MLGISLSYDTFIVLSYEPSIHSTTSFFGAFIMKGYLILLGFFAYIEMIM